ncbi:hypothetical protein ABFS82_05G127100 [Erythranthe guttata]|uniref:Uncharacterized protein n=1 Tax=Erythranthe guttata TaxID=4155 RepID=A0A022QMN9_ERYGU|nr:PREDICTED: uncharacterized protein LOC105967008 [Erythranthe guttata]EYU29221.1 hypothetical protein MIMGU_mgv1a025734mg [Erythranthe guttata]|eukprot:XP_012847026.1 PREDICTED: uncharacterized protein LOC105967008 [Erythranthe guttata]
MKAKSSASSSSSSFSSVDVEKKVDELKKYPHHLSASYIRSLVKQLTSSATTTTKQDPSEENGFLSRHQDPTRIISSTNSDEQPENPPPQKRRPRRRRRTQTSKPYQEKMLNMAEARREIVTALKLHRKAREIQPARPEFHPPGQPESGFYSWPVSCSGFALPGRALGLNLNLQDFDKTAVFQYSGANPPSTDHEPPSTFASAATPAAAEVVGFVPPALDFVESPFDEVMEFPGWMSADESVNDFLPDAYFQDRALPCMKIEEIGGIDDGDWLA